MTVHKPNLEELHRKTIQVRDSAPETYCGVPVPESFAPNWDQPEVHFWRMGVQAGLDRAADYAAEARAATLREAAETINNEDLPQDIGDVADICEGARWATAQLIRMAEEEK